MNIEIHAVTVCVNYAHLFKHCIPNKRFFKRWVIVTTKEDTDTLKYYMIELFLRVVL